MKSSSTRAVVLLGSLLILVQPAFSQGGSAPQATDLRVENQVLPLGLDTVSPRFSWSILDSDRGSYQSAYQILVASREDFLDDDKGNVYNSNKVLTSQQLYNPFQGAPLLNSRRYYWKVRVWDEQNVIGPWSANGTFDLMPDTTQWSASYIWDGTTVENDTAYLRKSFTLDQTTTLGKVYVSAHEDLCLWVNGTRLLYGPATGDPYFGMQVVPLDVTPYLLVGENVIAARVQWGGGDGNAGVRAEPAFTLQADFDLADGSQTTILSDATWRVLAQTPFDESAPLRGPFFGKATTVEDFDARLEPVGWTGTGFDDSTWDPATVVQPCFKLRAQSIPNTKVLEEIPATSIVVDLANAVTIVDFGRNVAGWISLKINGATPGTRITVYYSEEQVNGRIVRDRNGITDMWDAYTCRGGGSEIFEPDIGYLGFRYVEIEGYPGAVDSSDISLMRSGTELQKLGSFCSSSNELDEVLGLCYETQEACSQGLLVDCPQREQTQHMTDALVQGRNLAAYYAESNLLSKCLRDIRDGNLGMGVLRSHHPSERVTIIPEWTLSWIHAVDFNWMQTGDMNLVAELYPDVVSALNSFEGYADPKTGLLLSLPIPSYSFQGVDLSFPGLATLNCLYYEALRVGKDLANLLGNESDETRFCDLQSTLGVSIRLNLFDGVDRYYDGIGSTSKSQLSSALPILFGIETGSRAQALAKSVSADGLQVGTIGGYYVSRALRLWDFGDELLNIVEDDLDQHWGNMLVQGATTTYEDWQGQFSLSHAWSAYPMAFAQDGFVGIAPLAPGWSRAEIRPRLPKSMTFAEGNVPTPRGVVHARWEQEDASRELEVTTPANMPSLVSIPTAGLGDILITEGGQAIFQRGAFLSGVTGISLDGIEGDYVRVRLDPGSYAFLVTGVPLQAIDQRSNSSIQSQ